MAAWRVQTILTVSLVVSSLATGCSETTKYRVLCFFFDGVPKPGEAAAEGRKETDLPEVRRQAKQAPTEKILVSHPPYKTNRCRACHDPSLPGLQLIKTLEEGLCFTCHSDPAAEARYVHGPVAVNACLDCHHYHESSHQHLLLDDATALCFRCHDRQDLTEGPHHAKNDSQSCVECHSPHGGDDRFFLKRSEH